MKKKAGRPRGENYEKNLKYRKDVKGSSVIEEKIHLLTKSLFQSLNLKRYEDQNIPVYTHEELEMQNNGVILRPAWRVPFEDLRNASYGTSLIGAIHKIDVDLTAPYSKKRYNKTDDQGYGFMLLDEEETPSEYDKQMIRRACDFFHFMGYKTEGWYKRDKIKSVIEMMTRDTLTIDTVCFHLIKNSFGKIIEIKYLDPATIFEVDPEKGFYGDLSVHYVQIIDGNVVCTFGPDEIILRRKHFSSDVYRRGTGFSPTEACILDLVGVVNALKFNKDRFTARNPPLGFFSVNADVPREKLIELQEQYTQIFTGNYNNYKLPILSTSAGDIKYQSLNMPSDLLFDKLIQWLSSLVLAAHGTSQEELGIKLMASQTLSEPAGDSKAERSSRRRIKSHLAFFCDVFNDIKDFSTEFDSYTQCFYGINEKDIDAELDRDKKKSGTYMTIDELRAEKDLKPLGEKMAELYNLTPEQAEKARFAGNYIDSQVFVQVNGMLQDNLSGEEAGPGMDEDNDFGDFGDDEESGDFEEEEPPEDEDFN